MRRGSGGTTRRRNHSPVKTQRYPTDSRSSVDTCQKVGRPVDGCQQTARYVPKRLLENVGTPDGVAWHATHSTWQSKLDRTTGEGLRVTSHRRTLCPAGKDLQGTSSANTAPAGLRVTGAGTPSGRPAAARPHPRIRKRLQAAFTTVQRQGTRGDALSGGAQAHPPATGSAVPVPPDEKYPASGTPA